MTLGRPFHVRPLEPAALNTIYLFIDGIGFGKNDPATNPFSKFAGGFLRELGGLDWPERPAGWHTAVTDAHLGMEGLPQSATGQTALWTGINGPQVMGHHKTGFPGPTLIRVIEEHSIVKVFNDHGRQATLLNAYGDKYIERIKTKPRFKSASTHVQQASGQALKTFEDLDRDDAIFMDITHEIMHRFYPESESRYPLRDPRQRGRDLVAMAGRYDLVLYEYFLTDKAGHDMNWEWSEKIIANLEAFVDGIVECLDPERQLLLITSDHGNMEDLSTKSHTPNKVPTFAFGQGADRIPERVNALTDIAPLIYERHDIPVTFND